MITFQNDHLISPVLCKLLYDAVPVNLHRPVVFTAHAEALPVFADEYGYHRGLPSLGTCYGRGFIGIHLQSVYYHGARLCECWEASLWRTLVEVCLHEFGHVATLPRFRYVPDGAYWNDPKAHKMIEAAADCWRDITLDRVVEWQPDLGQPKRLGPYLDGRLAKAMRSRRRYPRKSAREDRHYIHNWRCYKTGGQLGVGEVARKLGLVKERPQPAELDGRSMIVPMYRKIRKLAGEDIGRPYIDKAGRRHLYFQWGDVRKLAQRIWAAP